jgi:hypothetical protein
MIKQEKEIREKTKKNVVNIYTIYMGNKEIKKKEVDVAFHIILHLNLHCICLP